MIEIHTYGQKNMPTDLPDFDRIFDCRSLPNPYRVAGLNRLTGRYPEVQRFVVDCKAGRDLLAHILASTSGYTNLVIGVYCHGGKHRSVAIAQRLEAPMRHRGQGVTVKHHSLGA